jgi:hypothetical protein
MPLAGAKRKKIESAKSRSSTLPILTVAIVALLASIILLLRGVINSNIFIPSTSVSDIVKDNPAQNTTNVISNIVIQDIPILETFGSTINSPFQASTDKFAYFIVNGNATSKVYRLGNDALKTLFITDYVIQEPRVYDNGNMSFIRNSSNTNEIVIYDAELNASSSVYKSEQSFTLISHYYDLFTDRFLFVEKDSFGIPILSYISSKGEGKQRILRSDQIPINSQIKYVSANSIYFKNANNDCQLLNLTDVSLTNFDCRDIPQNTSGLILEDSNNVFSIYSQSSKSSKDIGFNTVEYTINSPFLIRNYILYIAKNKFINETRVKAYNILTDTEMTLANFPEEDIANIFVIDGQLYGYTASKVFLYSQKIIQTEELVFTSYGNWIEIFPDSPAIGITLLNQKDQ